MTLTERVVAKLKELAGKEPKKSTSYSSRTKTKNSCKKSSCRGKSSCKGKK